MVDDKRGWTEGTFKATKGDECVVCSGGVNISEFHEKLRKVISENGHQVLGVQGQDRPTFSYTIGLFEKYGFELIVLGVPAHFAAVIFNDIVSDHLSKGKILDLNVENDQWTTLPCMFKECNDSLVREYAVQAFEYYQLPVKVIQMVMCDREGRLPNNLDFDMAYMSKFQRLLYAE